MDHVYMQIMRKHMLDNFEKHWYAGYVLYKLWPYIVQKSHDHS